MKKLVFIFVILFTLLVNTGCKSRDNTIRFNPKIDGVTTETADEYVTDDTESNADKTTVAIINDNTELAVTSFAGDKLDTNVGYHVVRGTTPKNTHHIKVNDYALSKYVAGQTEWNYITSAVAGSMVKGENKYTVTAFDASSNQIGSKDFTIVYSEPESLPSVGVNAWMIFGISILISGLYFVIRRLQKRFAKSVEVR